MFEYKRYISGDFVEALNMLYAEPEGEWWRCLLADEEIFLAFRDETINAYYRGCSLAQISFSSSSKQVTTRTHYKYLLKPDLKDNMITARDGRFEYRDNWPKPSGSPFIESLCDLKSIKKAAQAYAVGEKVLVGKILGANADKVFDVEIALTRQLDEEDPTDLKRKSVADRIDIAAVTETKECLQLVFYEAKLFENGELRASDAKMIEDPEERAAKEEANVIRQVRRYEKLLKSFGGQIRDSCQRSARNVLDLEGFNLDRRKSAQRVLDAIAANRFSVNILPVVVVGSFDIDQRMGKVWTKHRKKLELGLTKTAEGAVTDGAKRVLAAGDGAKIGLDCAPEGGAV